MKSRLFPLAPAVALLAAGTLAGCSASTARPSAATGSTGCSQHAVGGDPLAAPPLQQQQVDPKLAALVPASAKGETVTFGVAPDLPPVNFGKDGQQRGFEPDLLRAAGQRIGVHIRFRMLDNPLQAYSADQVDGIAGFFNDTKERQKLGSFIDYVNASVSAITAGCNPLHITQASDLCGKKVTAAVGTVQLAQLTDPKAPKSLVALCARAGKPKPVPVQADTSVSAVGVVSSGRADAMVIDAPIALNVVQQSKGKLSIGYTQTLTDPVGVMFNRKFDTTLIGPLQRAYQSLVADGTYARILDGYGMRTGHVSQVTINRGESA